MKLSKTFVALVNNHMKPVNLYEDMEPTDLEEGIMGFLRERGFVAILDINWKFPDLGNVDKQRTIEVTRIDGEGTRFTKWKIIIEDDNLIIQSATRLASSRIINLSQSDALTKLLKYLLKNKSSISLKGGVKGEPLRFTK